MSRILRKLRRSLRKRIGPRTWDRDIATLSDDPLVLLIVGGIDYSFLFRRLRKRDVWFFVRHCWNHDDARKIAKDREQAARHVRKYPGHRFVFLCNTETELQKHREAGLDALFSSHDGLIDERIFRIRPEIEKRYDAVYDAQLNPFKRHQLAARVPSLALVSYIHAPQFSQAYADDVRRVLRHAHWISDPLAPHWRWLTPHEVCLVLNQSRVGLCLSAEEGAMFASTQYLLCGLPVVSTESKGGRDVFFEPGFTRIVEDDPDAVAEAVAGFVEAPPDPQQVRARALERVRAHRSRLIDRIEAIYREVGAPCAYGDRWEEFWFSRMLAPADLRDVVGRIEAGEVPVPRPDHCLGPSRRSTRTLRHDRH